MGDIMGGDIWGREGGGGGGWVAKGCSILLSVGREDRSLRIGLFAELYHLRTVINNGCVCMCVRVVRVCCVCVCPSHLVDGGGKLLVLEDLRRRHAPEQVVPSRSMPRSIKNYDWGWRY